MLYLEQFQNNRVEYLKHYQRLRLSLNDRNFSLCSKQYGEKFPNISQLESFNTGYPRNQTLFFLSRKSSSSEMKSSNENQQQIGIMQKNKTSMSIPSKSLVRDNNQQLSNENSPTRWYHQVSRNVSESTPKGNQVSSSFSLSNNRSSPEPYRPTTAPLVLEENIRRAISARIKSNIPSRSRNPRIIDLTDNFNNLTNSSSRFQLKSKQISENDNQFRQDSYINTSSSCDQFFDSSIVINPTNETPRTIDNHEDEPKILHRDSQCKIDGFQHIVNLGSWQNHSKIQQIEQPVEKSKEIEHEENLSSNKFYEYKSPFSEEHDQAIALQTQIITNNNNNSLNEWNLKDFYRDVKTQFEPDTNTKSVFEKCLKLSRLQANTIKWEQRRRQNLNIYNRLIKNSTFDNNSIVNFNGNFSPNLTDLKRELRCNECKRVSCLGNCAPGQEYHQYKRYTPLSSLPSTREQIRYKFGLRSQRSMIDIRPRSTQQTNINPVVVVPLFENDSQTKRQGKSFRSPRRETLTFLSSHKILS